MENSLTAIVERIDDVGQVLLGSVSPRSQATITALGYWQGHSEETIAPTRQ